MVKALDHRHQRPVALKIRRVRGEQAREELLGEARLLLGLEPHPALPLVREDFFVEDEYVVAMDWVDGTDLARILAERGAPGLAPSSVVAYLAEAAEALTFLHAQDPPIVHGDVKPANLILTRGGHVKLVDFGLSSTPLMLGRRSGTPGYRAPELATGSPPSRASDVYGLAATAFALLTGSAPQGVLPAWEGIDPALAAAPERIFGTKMRSVIKKASGDGIQAIVDQQFEVAAQILAAGLVPIVEPEVDIHCPDKARAEGLLKAALLQRLNKLPGDQLLMLKITLPEQADFYAELVKHPKVLK